MVSVAVDQKAALLERHAFVVAGMHRSGTSAMARTLSLLGASLPQRLMKAAPDNPSGFWESQSIAALNDEVLQQLDSDWDDVFSFRPREYLSNFDHFYAGRAAELLGQEFEDSEVIVLKDPRISVLTTFWDRVLREAAYKPHYVVMVRNPLEVADSLQVRDGFPREKSLLLWSSYMIAADRDTRNKPRTFVSFDDLMNDWRSVRRRLEAEASLPFPRDTTAAAVEIDRYLDRTLQHHTVSPDDLLGRTDVPEEVKVIYGIFAAACRGKPVDTEAVDAIAAEFSKMDRLVGPLLADLRLSARALSGELAELREVSKTADSRAEGLAGQLERERVEHEQSLADVASRASTLETVRARLCLEVEEKQRQFDELADRLATTEREKTHLSGELESERALRETVAADLDGATNKLMNSARKIDELIGSLEVAETARRALEQRFNAHFHETASLSRIILEAHQSTASESAKAGRIREFYDVVVSQPRWWSILPRWQQSRLQAARLRRLGLFDASSYLRKNPDVAAAGEDPLHHYLHHGIDEQRQI
jgi:hypothetical protein